MQILILGPTHQFGKGGIETQIEQLSSALEDLGHPCHVFDTFHQPWTLGSVRQLISHLAHCDVVLLMGLNLKAYLFCLLSNRNVLLSYHTISNASGWELRLRKHITKHLPKVYNSYFVASIEHQGNLPPKVLYPCYASSAFSQQANEALAWHERPIAAGFLGRLIPEKGPQIFLKACAILGFSDLKLQVIGAGPSCSELQALAATHHLNVDFTGGLNAAGVARALQSLKVLVIPSIWHEPFGLVMLEGIAAGCHVVASAVGGLPEAGADLAIYVPPGDPRALACALSGLLEGPPPQRLEARLCHLERFKPGTLAQLLANEMQEMLRQ